MSEKDCDYRERYVAYMDILGFSAIVERADTDEKAREAILTIIRSLRDTLKEVPPTGFQFTQFSDCIVISTERTAEGLLAVCSACVRLVTDLLMKGVMLRGAIVAGNLAHTDDYLFGTGLLSAYKSDQSGGSPRILLDDAVVSDIGQYHYANLIFEDDTDLQKILHVLWDFEMYNPVMEYRDNLKDQADIIIARILEHSNHRSYQASIIAKWRWKRRYWNETVGRNRHMRVIP